jgi:uncharacterized spore protein YtfJ
VQIEETISQARDAMTVKRVFGEPYERDGVVVIPAARIMGGAGGGSGTDDEGASGKGGGFGLHAEPAGVYVIRGDRVSWQPAINVNRIVMGGQLVGIIALLVLRTLIVRLTRSDTAS